MGFKNTREIWEALLSGKKLRSCEFKDGTYIYFDEVEGVVFQNGTPTFFKFYSPEDWQLYQEPNPALYLWALKAEGGLWQMSAHYCSEEEAQRIWEKYARRRLDWSKLEVE